MAPRRLRFGLKFLLAVVTATAVALFFWREHVNRLERRGAMISKCEDIEETRPFGFTFLAESRFLHADGEHYRAFVLNKYPMGFPMRNQYKIAVVDDDYRDLLHEEIFQKTGIPESCHIAYSDGHALLKVKCRQRNSPRIGTVSYELSPTAVERVGEIVRSQE